MQTGTRHAQAYSDVPVLHRSAVLATLQIAGWLFFRPSAWRRYIERIEPTLAPDFSLASLTRAQLGNPALRRLLLLGHVLAPILLTALLTVEMALLGVPPRLIAIRVLAVAVMAIAASLMNGTGSMAAIGIASGILGLLGGGVVFAAAAARIGQTAFRLTANVSSLVTDFFAHGSAGRMTLIVAIGIAASGMFAGVSSVGPGVSPRRAELSGRPSLGGLLIGLVCGAFFLVAAVGSAALLPFAIAISAGGFLAGLISALWITRLWGRSALFGAACALNNHLLINVIAPLTHDVVVVGIMLGIILGAWFALPYVLTEAVAGSWAGAVAGSLGFIGGWLLTLSAASKQYMTLGAHVLPGLLSLEAAVLLGLTEVVWRPLLCFPFEEAWNLLLLRADQLRATADPSTDRAPHWLRFHSVFWDEHQRLRLYGLEEHLILVCERCPEEGALALERVATGRQRWAATAAQIELAARRLQRCDGVEAIARAHRDLGSGGGESGESGSLGGPASALLQRLSGISQDVAAALAQSSAHNQRLGLSAVQQRLEALIAEADRSSDRYAARFRPVAAHWRKLVAEQAQALSEAVELRQELDNPYVIGVPLTLAQELFVGRTDVSARIEQLLLDRRRPPLLLYGQRRMGKTSLLNNLGRLLPTGIVPLFVDLQGPASAASDHAGLLYNLARSMIDSARRQRGVTLPPLGREALAQDPFTAFDEWLGRVEAALGERTALLTLDEFEALAAALRTGRFEEAAVLGMLRHVVQHRPRIKVLLASSHTLDELSLWSSYFVNVQVVQVGYLDEEDARRLIEQPVPGFALRYEPAASRRLLDLTRGHPFLIQLLCAEIVSLKNEQEPAVRRLATPADVDEAVAAALLHGSFFFADIERNQVDAAGLGVLRHIAAQGEAAGAARDELTRLVPEPELDAVLARLRRRDLLEPGGRGQRFQVELIRRWFADGAARLR